MLATTPYRFILLDSSDDGVTTVTLNRAEKRNALSLEVMRELIGAFEAIGADRAVKAVILRGLGPAFSAGHDLREMLERSVAEYREVFDVCVKLMETIQSIPQPVIAEVAGIATAAGCQLVATCDLALASSEARFATPGVKIGLFCTTPMVALTRAIGRKRAMEMLLTGDTIDARTALAWGLVNRVVTADALDAEVRRFTDQIVSRSAAAIRLGKRAFYDQIERPLEHAYTTAGETMVRNIALEDAAEGMDAFLTKRPAVWKGR